MKLPDLAKAAKDKSSDPALRAYFLKAVGTTLDIETTDQRRMNLIKHVSLWLVLVLTAATGALAILGSIKKIEIDDHYFTPLWTTFGVGLLGSSATAFVNTWRSHKD